MTTRDHAMRMLGWRLRQAGLPTPDLDARILVQAVTGATGIDMLREPGTLMRAEEEKRLGDFERRRLAREPVSRILGLREFWGLPFCLSGATLDPRADSETLIEVSLSLLKGRHAPRLLDLGTGSGCLLLALLHERPDAVGIGIDISQGALDVARENAARLGLGARASFQRGDWAAGLDEQFDLVISNPPYIVSGEIAALDEEVRGHDPRLALDGGHDGLDAYRALAAALPDILTPGGHGVIELGEGQAEPVRHLMEAVELSVLRVVPDLGGIERALVAIRQRR